MKKLFLSVFGVIAMILTLQASASDINMGRLQSIPNLTILEEGVLGGGYPPLDALIELKQQGFRAVIDLRTKKEGVLQHQKRIEQLGLVYYNIPIRSSININQVQELREILANSDNYPILIHCAVGGRVEKLWDQYEKLIQTQQSLVQQ